MPDVKGKGKGKGKSVRIGGTQFAYDPDQDPEEKRQVRRNYRALNQDYEGGINPKDVTTEQLMSKVQQADTLFEKGKAPQEATLDSMLLVRMSNMGAHKARAMKSSAGAFDVDDFVAKLVSFMGGKRQLLRAADGEDDAEIETDDVPLEWEKIGRRALAKSRRVPVIDFMLGPLSLEQKKRAHTQRIKLEKNKADERKPQEIREEDIQRSDNETSKNVAQLENLLNEIGDPVNLFRFFINPNDFGQSVENLFHLSFLIRDGKCALETDESTGEPMIFACEPPTADDYNDGLKKNQIVFEFDMPTWERAIEAFNIQQPIIPHRMVSETTFGNTGWHG
ncbi:hypothetical protein PUNSTDRAFT_62925 [Punctularia strigosozonata HHB-11173 SS5]|uniref:uncharacterized protein n=1 Tax=Punctularia strigosozonata (strain HHB-11173) TaxID=741275 RepID=UPI00044183FC|nr:uncharacterized protein PUNSTDRAFT_62925 [Punctularia strigosozonata HHB-11173 SS5]EIN11513.1 hypothetical protein PUNSTDRAFT_62925 [Punctularia strigosozonata HHB-11173 SS5]